MYEYSQNSLMKLNLRFNLFKRFRNARTRQLEQVLKVLGQEAESYKLVSDLAQESLLGARVYPLLADLNRQGLVEHQWLNEQDRPKLAYRLTPQGRAHVKGLLEQK